jgi:HEAT repeat protein
MVRIGAQATPLLRQRLKSADAHDRRVAAELLVRIGPPDAGLAALLRSLLTDEDGYVRKAAIDGLGIVGSPAKEAVDDLERVATNDPILPRRVAARIALIQIAGASEERVRALAAFLELKEPCDGAAVYAASALGRLGPKANAAESQLLTALKHTEHGVRIAAAHVLGEIGAKSPQAVTALIDLLKNDPEREARRSAAASLGNFGPAARAAIPALHSALKGDAKGGWWVAADALGKIGGAEVVPVLIEALAHPDDDIRFTSMKALGNLGVVARPAVKALQKASQEDPRPNNRAAAAEAVRKIEQAVQKMKPDLPTS